VSGRDVGASVRQRLLNQSRAQERPFQELLQYFAMERFLYRLSKSSFSDRFVLKGALLLTAWRAPLSFGPPWTSISPEGRVTSRAAAKPVPAPVSNPAIQKRRAPGRVSVGRNHFAGYDNQPSRNPARRSPSTM
jgi:hypothetical protein